MASRSVWGEAARLFAGVFLAKGLDFALYLLLARSLGVEQYGRYTFALSYTLLFSTLGDLGLSTVFTREVARDPQRARELLAPSMAIKLVLALICLASVFAMARWPVPAAAQASLVTPIVLGMLLVSLALLFDGLLRAAGRAGAAGVVTAVQSLTALVAGAALLGYGLGPRAGALAYLAGACFRLCGAAWASRDLWWGSWPRQRRWSEHATLVREALPIALSGMFVAIYFRIDSVILRALQGERAVGLYAGIYRIFEAFALLAVTFRSVLFPVMARTADGPREALAVLCRRSIRLHLLVTLGIAVFFTFEAEPIVRLTLGDAYAPAAPGLAILVWALPGSYMADTLMFLLAARRRQSLATWAVAATAAFNVALNLTLVPRFSFLGASVATAASEWMCFAVLLAMFQRDVPVPGLASLAWRPAAASAVLALGWWRLASTPPAGAVGLMLAGLATAATYGALLTLMGALTRRDLDRALERVPGWRTARPRPS
jgi:O-antigen/teichoic acid export membrane protein